MGVVLVLGELGDLAPVREEEQERPEHHGHYFAQHGGECPDNLMAALEASVASAKKARGRHPAAGAKTVEGKAKKKAAKKATKAAKRAKKSA